MLSNTQLEELAVKMSVPLEWVGFKDMLPKKLKYNRTYIINMDDAYDADGNANEGTHWTAFQVNEYPNGNKKAMYFDSYGAPPPEIVKKRVKDNFNCGLPYSKKDIQSMMADVCGWYCLAWSHFCNAYEQRSKCLYQDSEMFLDLFDDLNKSVDWKRNEYWLSQFFREPNQKGSGIEKVWKDTTLADTHTMKGTPIEVEVKMNK